MSKQQEVMSETMPLFLSEMACDLNRAENDYGDFTEYRLTQFHDHLARCVNKLIDFLEASEHDELAIMRESIHVANEAYMIWWHAKERIGKGKVSV